MKKLCDCNQKNEANAAHPLQYMFCSESTNMVSYTEIDVAVSIARAAYCGMTCV